MEDRLTLGAKRCKVVLATLMVVIFVSAELTTVGLLRAQQSTARTGNHTISIQYDTTEKHLRQFRLRSLARVASN
jgi:hypothetical protein